MRKVLIHAVSTSHLKKLQYPTELLVFIVITSLLPVTSDLLDDVLEDEIDIW